MVPQFPQFKAIGIEDRDAVESRLARYGPETSELNFTNMFIWRSHYGFEWSVWRDWLLVIGTNSGNGVHALPPVGPASRVEVSRMLLEWLRQERKIDEPRIDRADARLVAEVEGDGAFTVEPVRDHFDYVYRTEDLIALSGKAYRAKRNHLNYLLRAYGGSMAYEPIREEHVEACREVAGNWCSLQRCEEDLNLVGEWDAIQEALGNLRLLRVKGAVITINGKVEAFTLGERLNGETAVVHLEKANTEIRGLYAAINQQFCEKAWPDVPFINREQDLGDPGLREAKLSYNPDRMIEKYRIGLAAG